MNEDQLAARDRVQQKVLDVNEAIVDARNVGLTVNVSIVNDIVQFSVSL